MTEREVINLFRSIGALLENDHFVYSSGRHGSAYINKREILIRPEKAFAIAGEIADRFRYSDIECVVAPEYGATKLGMLTAVHLSQMTGREVFSVDAEKGGFGPFVIPMRNVKYVQMKRVLLVEDIMNTGRSTKEVVHIIKQVGGNLVAACAIANRGNVTAKQLDWRMHLDFLCSLDMESWEEADCPLCKDGVPVNVDYGHGKAFVERPKPVWGSEKAMQNLESME